MNITFSKLNNYQKIFSGFIVFSFFAFLGFLFPTKIASAIAVGDSYQGGIVAYILSPSNSGYVAGEVHGLIAAPSDQSSGIYWHSDSSTEVGSVGTELGTGIINTNKIVSKYGSENNAAKICSDLVINGYNDWYLPSKDELNSIISNKESVGGFNDFGNYWSSSESSAGKAWYIMAMNSTYNTSNKNSPYLVRAVRSFSIPDPVITPAILGIIPPVTGETPTTTVTETPFYTATISWNGNPTTFLKNTTYTAIVTITPKNEYILEVPENFFTVEGATSVTNDSDSGIVTIVFPETGPLGIGDYYQGGKVAYILQPSDPGYVGGELHGLIADQGGSHLTTWGCLGTSIVGADGTAIGTGNQNTTDITNGCSASNIAAKLAANRITNGYDDWYLPSKDELNKLYINRIAIGGFQNNWYWSSSEYDENNVWVQSFQYGNQSGSPKNSALYAHFIRSFVYPGKIVSPAILGVTPPDKGQTPVSTLTETNSYTATISWSGNPTTFSGGTIYTTTITITPKDGYTLTGIPENFFTIEGVTSVVNNESSGTITAVFPRTESLIISLSTINGLTVPVTNAVPVSTITETNEYSANVLWGNNPKTFKSNTIYTATVTINPKEGYTLLGIPENFFRVLGATSVTNNAGSGTVNVIFPKTLKNTIPGTGSMPSPGGIIQQGQHFPSCLSGDLFNRNTGEKCGSGGTKGNTSHSNYTRILKLIIPRMTGEDILDLQNDLNTRGYNVGIPDGVYGSKTYSTVIQFQIDNKLKPDGKVGPMTREAMQ